MHAICPNEAIDTSDPACDVTRSSIKRKSERGKTFQMSTVNSVQLRSVATRALCTCPAKSITHLLYGALRGQRILGSLSIKRLRCVASLLRARHLRIFQNVTFTFDAGWEFQYAGCVNPTEADVLYMSELWTVFSSRYTADSMKGCDIQKKSGSIDCRCELQYRLR